ncbi:MAG TPA: LPXTG cell wall anchor domain-containing protein [Bryobacteraceae bacterium]|nr:LPXTG cell wall anchor domain-containing protein [Bryobacteraceae bacterium]
MRKMLLCGLAFAAGLVTVHARADQWDKKTILTVSNQPIQIRDTVLEPGQYVLRLLDSQSDRHIVQIFDRYQTHIINTVLAVASERMEPTGGTRFTFWETPPGTAKAMRDWYYPGDTIGQEFPYPKHLQQIAMVTPAPALELAPAPAPEPVAENPEPAPAATPEPAPEPQPEQQPAEVAQNTPSTTPAPAEPAPTPAPPAELPKTGSSYPLIGLGGGVLLALFAMLRLKRAVG